MRRDGRDYQPRGAQARAGRPGHGGGAGGGRRQRRGGRRAGDVRAGVLQPARLRLHAQQPRCEVRPGQAPRSGRGTASAAALRRSRRAHARQPLRADARARFGGVRRLGGHGQGRALGEERLRARLLRGRPADPPPLRGSRERERSVLDLVDGVRGRPPVAGAPGAARLALGPGPPGPDARARTRAVAGPPPLAAARACDHAQRQARAALPVRVVAADPHPGPAALHRGDPYPPAGPLQPDAHRPRRALPGRGGAAGRLAGDRRRVLGHPG